MLNDRIGQARAPGPRELVPGRRRGMDAEAPPVDLGPHRDVRRRDRVATEVPEGEKKKRKSGEGKGKLNTTAPKV